MLRPRILLQYAARYAKQFLRMRTTWLKTRCTRCARCWNVLRTKSSRACFSSLIGFRRCSGPRLHTSGPLRLQLPAVALVRPTTADDSDEEEGDEEEGEDGEEDNTPLVGEAGGKSGASDSAAESSADPRYSPLMQTDVLTRLLELAGGGAAQLPDAEATFTERAALRLLVVAALEPRGARLLLSSPSVLGGHSVPLLLAVSAGHSIAIDTENVTFLPDKDPGQLVWQILSLLARAHGGGPGEEVLPGWSAAAVLSILEPELIASCQTGRHAAAAASQLLLLVSRDAATLATHVRFVRKMCEVASGVVRKLDQPADLDGGLGPDQGTQSEPIIFALSGLGEAPAGRVRTCAQAVVVRTLPVDLDLLLRRCCDPCCRCSPTAPRYSRASRRPPTSLCSTKRRRPRCWKRSRCPTRS